MPHYPQPGASRIETSLPPAWKRSYGALSPEEDDDDFANGPDPLVRVIRSGHRAHYRPRSNYGSEYPHMSFVRPGAAESPESAPPLPYSSRRQELHTPYPAPPVYEGVRHVKKQVGTAPRSHERFIEEEHIELIDSDMPSGYRREVQVPVVERHERTAYSEASYNDSEDENHVFYSFGDSLRNSDGRDSQRDGSISDIESSVVPEEGKEENPNATERGAATHHVLESQYAGDGYEAGHHSVKVTAVLSERAAISQSLFRWM